jgi:hypothetical protein
VKEMLMAMGKKSSTGKQIKQTATLNKGRTNMVGGDMSTNVSVSVGLALIVALGLTYLGFRVATNQGTADVKIENRQVPQ